MNSANAIDNNNNNNNNNNNETVILVTNMINYLNVSFYESLFTYNHEQARAELNAIYESVTLKCTEPPSLDDVATFYRNVLYLKSVTDTDDSTYHTYMRQLKSYIQKLKLKDSSPSSSS
jgi:hypothetical protein